MDVQWTDLDKSKGWHWCLLWWGVLDEVNTLFNVGLETLDGNFEELLFGVGGVLEHVNGVGYTISLYEPLVTYSKFQGLS